MNGLTDLEQIIARIKDRNDEADYEHMERLKQQLQVRYQLIEQRLLLRFKSIWQEHHTKQQQ